MGSVYAGDERATAFEIYPIEHTVDRRTRLVGVFDSLINACDVVDALIAGGFRASEMHVATAGTLANGACLLEIDTPTEARKLLAAELVARHDARTASFRGWLTETEFAAPPHM